MEEIKNIITKNMTNIIIIIMIDGDLTFTSLSKNCIGANLEVVERRDPDDNTRNCP